MTKKQGGTTPLKRLVTVAIAISIGFGTICWSVLSEIADRDREVARVNAANLVATIGSDISRNIELFDLSLQAAADGIALENLYLVPPAVRQMILFDRSATAQGLGTIFVLDTEGHVLAESRSVTPRHLSFATRDFFKIHETTPASGRYISSPYLTDDNEYVIAVSRRINDADGNFAGVVAGTMKLDYLRALLERIRRKPGDSLTLLRENGTAITRAPFDINFVGRMVANTPIFRKFANKDNGSFEEVAKVDGVRRLYTFEHVRDLPFILSYGVSIEGLYAQWWESARLIGAIVLALCLVNMALVIFLARSLRRSSNAEEKLKVMATTDALTGLNNRRRFDQIIVREWNRARRSEQPLSLLMIDADRFKAYNDTFGHQAGDTALAAIADCIAQATRRAGECAARYGGEEFAVVLADDSAERGLQIAEAIRARIAELRTVQGSRPDSTPTVSIGVATLHPQHGLTTRDLVKAADAALYEAKRQGRDRAVAASSRLQAVAARMAA